MLKDSERHYLRAMRALATDHDGNEHLVGLTVEETAFFMELSQCTPGGDFPSKAQIERYVGLQNRHEESRLAILDEERCQRMS